MILCETAVRHVGAGTYSKSHKNGKEPLNFLDTRDLLS